MKRINQYDANTPAWFNDHFHNSLGVTDLPRLEKLARHYEGGRGSVYVDVGCWDSPMPMILAERYPTAHIYALDYADQVISFLAPRIPQVRYQVIKTCYRLPFEDETVDYIVAGELIEHLEKPADFIQECLRVLKPGGWIAVSTPHEEKGKEVGGPLHLWSWTVRDVEKLLGTTETEVIQEDTFKTILAWRRK